MRLKREQDSLVFSLNDPERLLLAHVLRELIEKYRLKPDELDAETAAVWYSTRGCATAGLSAEETKEWLENLHACKSAGLQRLEGWVKQLGKEGKEHSTLRVSTNDAPAFVTAINDYRLAMAARHDVGQPEMDAHFPWQLAKLPPNRQQAVLEIHVLAWIMEETLRLLEDQ